MRMGFGLPIRGRNWGWNLGFGHLSVRQKVLYSMEYSGIAFYKRMALFQRKFWNFAETPSDSYSTTRRICVINVLLVANLLVRFAVLKRIFMQGGLET